MTASLLPSATDLPVGALAYLFAEFTTLFYLGLCLAREFSFMILPNRRFVAVAA